MTVTRYFQTIFDAVSSTLKGMRITGKMFLKVNKQGAITVQFPEKRDHLPEGSRGLLFNDVEDCISCRQCSAACPVDCIYIEAEKKPPRPPLK